jgi:protein phosphatase
MLQAQEAGMLNFHGLTDVGRRREINEDTIHAQNGLFLVCDGVGGHQAGEVASRLAVEVIVEFLRRSEDAEFTWPHGYDRNLSHDANRLSIAIKLANRAIFRHAGTAKGFTGMGTTVAAVLVHPHQAQMTYAHVGDSRIYLLRSGSMRQLTRDDTWANLQAGRGGEPSRMASMSNVLTKALGAQEDVDFDVITSPLLDDDVVLVCSDGLTNMVPEQRILEIVSAWPRDPSAACAALVSDANAQGGRDNISVILFHHRTASPA